MPKLRASGRLKNILYKPGCEIKKLGKYSVNYRDDDVECFVDGLIRV